MTDSVQRLYKAFKPQKYTLTVDGNDQHMTFKGSVYIEGELLKPSHTLSLHSSELKITYATINGITVSHACNEKSQTVTLTSKTQMKGRLIVEIGFSGIITKPMHGLYPCFYEHDGIEKKLLATQFESHHAREVFPCIDEPEAKAVFNLTIVAPKDHIVVSNTPVISTKDEDGIRYTQFEDTPLMSTYLLAWVSGDLIYEESTTEHGVKVRSYATPVHKGKTAYSLEVAVRALDYMDDYFDIPYPLAKCDIIALPDFAAGAMENWGCITFRESAMLIDADQSDLTDKQHVAEVVTHELAHQWFGNLVTMRWWNDLWLNEGFASWIPYLVLNDLYPEWNMWEQFATADLVIGMRADALENTHPIVVDINNPEEIRSAFDSISYDKGCSVINLLFRYIGPEAFQKGLQNYLKKHAYNNAETFDLWAAWSESSGKDVASFMKSWTTSSGFPIVSASSKEDTLSISQQRFFLNPSHSQDTSLWPIPLMRSSDDTELLTTSSMHVSEPVKLNVGQSGFYRAIYSGAFKDAIMRLISNGSMMPVDTLGVVTDAAEAAKAGYHSTTEVLDLIKPLKNSQSEPLINAALGELGSCRSVLSETYDAFKHFTLEFVSPNLERLGFEKKDSDTIDDELLRPSLLAAASYAGDTSVITWALDIFNKALAPEDIRPDIRPLIYMTAVREIGDMKTYQKLLDWYKETTIPGERIGLASALTNFKDPDLIDKTLSLITSDTVKLQDSLYWIAYSLVSRHAKHTAWSWLKDNWQWVGDNFGKEKEIDYYLRYAAQGFGTKEHLDDYSKFFESVSIFGSKRAFEQGKETISWQTAWKARDEQKVIDWLNTQK